MSPHNYLVHLKKKHIYPSKHSHEMLLIDCSNQYMPVLYSLLGRRNLLAYMYCSHYLPTHTYVLYNYFTPRVVPTLLYTEKLHLNTRK